MDDRQRSQRIKTLEDVTSSALAQLNTFPNLRHFTSHRLQLSPYILENLNARKEFELGLNIIASDVISIKQRLQLPILIGLVGRYSSGKSALLNAFFNHIFAGKVPESLMRHTAKTPVDDRFTYITHSTYRELFPTSNELQVVTSDNEIFKQINFIDTPGTGWEGFARQEVSNLLSKADIMLFLFKPDQILDALSVEALNIKLTAYRDIPMWFVVTHASDYVRFGDSWGNLRIEEFKTDLRVAREKLRVRKTRSTEEASARDLVANNINFQFSENTFLVDSISSYGTVELLTELTKTFGSKMSKQRKIEQIDIDIESRFAMLDDVLKRMENHIYRLAQMLYDACTRVIQEDILRFNSTRIASSASVVSQRMLLDLQEASLRISRSATLSSSMPNLNQYNSVSLKNEPPQVVRLRQHLEAMRKRRNEYFELNRGRLLFDADSIDRPITNSIRKLSDQIDGLRPRFREVLLGLINPQRRDVRGFKKIGILAQIPKRTAASLDDRAKTLLQFFDQEYTPLIDFYSNRDNDLAIFAPQREMLESMQLDIPDELKVVREEINKLVNAAEKYAFQCLRSFVNIAMKMNEELADETLTYMRVSVFTPVKEALEFLFESGALERIKEIDDKKLEFYRQEFVDVFDGGRDAVMSHLKESQSNAFVQLSNVEEFWDAEWKKLSSDFNVLVGDGAKIALDIETLYSDSCDLVNVQIAVGTEDLRAKLAELGRQLESKAEDYTTAITDAIDEVESGQRLRQRWQLVSVILGLVLIGVGVSGLLRQGTENDAVLSMIVVLVVGAVIFVLGTSRLLDKNQSRRESVDALIKSKKNELLETMNTIAHEMSHEIKVSLTEHNNAANVALHESYGRAISLAEQGVSSVVPKLHTQIRSGAELGRDSIKGILGIYTQTAVSVNDLTNSELKVFSEQIERRFRQIFAQAVEAMTSESIALLDGYIKQYRDTAKSVATLRQKLRLSQ